VRPLASLGTTGQNSWTGDRANQPTRRNDSPTSRQLAGSQRGLHWSQYSSAKGPAAFFFALVKSPVQPPDIAGSQLGSDQQGENFAIHRSCSEQITRPNPRTGWLISYRIEKLLYDKRSAKSKGSIKKPSRNQGAIKHGQEYRQSLAASSFLVLFPGRPRNPARLYRFEGPPRCSYFEIPY